MTRRAKIVLGVGAAVPIILAVIAGVKCFIDALSSP